jgi:PiT family inorganic phosphate transporter
LEVALVVLVVALALSFDYTNGFHDAANAIATSVSTRALTPRVALVMAAAMNFTGALLGTEVAETIATSIVNLEAAGTHAELTVVLCALLGAIVWNLITWWFGLPSSSTHALIGGLVGAGLAGGMSVYWSAIVDKVVLPMIISPLVGFGLAFAVMVGVMWIFRYASPARTNRRFRIAQTASAAAMALGHGLQDAQKTMGVIYLALLTVGWANADEGIPLWVKLSAAAAISAGTYARPGTWLRRRVGLGPRAVRERVRAARPGLHHPHDHLGDHGRGRHPQALRGALGRGREHRRRVGSHHPRSRPGGRARDVGALPVPGLIRTSTQDVPARDAFHNEALRARLVPGET